MKLKLFLGLLFFSIIICAQKQPKVGLVLSGGGAKGFAHIGVLKEIEKAGIKIDYIGGTSMGAIVGGLYASGYSATQIEQIILETDFLKLLRDENPRRTKPFFTKEFEENEFVSFPVKGWKVGLPKAISRGQNILSLLTKLLRPVDSITNFKKLPIPFFCVATDIETGQEVLIEEGLLPIALRASSSFPTLLTPIEVDGKLLIDGGVSNNFPAKIMKDKGVDFIIGVDVQGKLNSRKNLSSALDILNQIVSYNMYEKSTTQLNNVDFYLHPDIYNYTVIDFDKGLEILKKGEKVAQEQAEILSKIKKIQSETYNRKPLELVDKKINIDKIIIKGYKNYTKAFILGKLNLKVGDSINYEILSDKIKFLSETDNFNKVYYNIDAENNKNTITFFVEESKENASLSFGAHYDDLYKTGFLFNYKHKKLLSKNDLLALNLVLGDNVRFDGTYFIDNGFYYSVGFKTRFNRFTSKSPFNGVPDNEKGVNFRYSEVTSQFFVQTVFDRKFAVGLGLEFKKIDATTESLNILNEEDVVTFDDSNYANLYAYLKFDSYDKKNFVTKGFYADLSFRWYLRSSDYANNFKPFSQAKGTIGFATSIKENLTFQYTSEAGFTFSNPNSNVFDFYLGGNNQNFINTFVSFYGYEFGELSNTSFVKSEFNFRYQFIEKHYISVIANYARLETNLLRNINIFSDISSGYAFGYSYDSFLGPIEIKYTWSPDTTKQFFVFNLGFWF